MGLLRLMFARLTFLIYSLPFSLREWLRIRIFQVHKRTYHVHGELIKLDRFSLISIIALYPRKEKLFSITCLIESLIENSYLPIVVMNDNSKAKEFAEALRKYPIITIIRPNVGRDFGAYQSGIKFIRRHKAGGFQSIKSLLLCNDSVHYFKETASWITQFIDSSKKNPWTSLFVNKQFHLHAQSFFQCFSYPLISSKTFESFWLNYYPTSIRHKVINNGEVALSQALLKDGYYPEKFVNSDKIISSLRSEFMSMELNSIFDKQLTISERNFLQNIENRGYIFDEIARTLDLRNPSHHLGLIATRNLGLPLKYDILRTGLCTEDDLRSVLGFAVPENSQVVLNLFLEQGSAASKKGISSVWNNYGLSKIN